MKFAYDTHRFPAMPLVEFQLGVPEESLSIGPLWGIVDTGADSSIVPWRYLQPLNLRASNSKRLLTAWGAPRVVETYLLDIGIGRWRFPALEVVGDKVGREVIVGRNLLNKLVLTLHGPQQWLEISA